MMSRIELLQEQYDRLGDEILRLHELPFDGDFWIIHLDGSVEHSSAFEAELLCKMSDLGNAYGTEQLALEAIELRLIIVEAQRLKGFKRAGDDNDSYRIEWSKVAKDEIHASMVESFDAYLPVYFDTLEDARAAVATLGFDRILKVLSAGN